MPRQFLFDVENLVRSVVHLSDLTPDRRHKPQNLKPRNTQNEERRPKTTTMTSLETLTGMKRAGETVTADDEATNTSSNTNKKPKQEDAEIAPEGVPSSATRNNDAVLEITPEKSSSGTTSTSTTTTLALEEMDDTSPRAHPRSDRE